MTAREVVNLIDWLRAHGYDNDKVVERIEAVGGKKRKSDRQNEGAED